MLEEGNNNSVCIRICAFVHKDFNVTAAAAVIIVESRPAGVWRFNEEIREREFSILFMVVVLSHSFFDRESSAVETGLNSVCPRTVLST